MQFDLTCACYSVYFRSSRRSSLLISTAEQPLKWLNKLFGFDRHGTTLAREIVAGLTTFTTMSYIVVVNPAILSAAGIPEGPSFVATVLVAVAGCYLMAFYANRPFAIAPYMGENAFIAFTVCKMLGFAWQTALAAIFIAGVLFILMTVLRLRQWVVDGVPTCLRYSFAVGIGLFLTFIGLNQTGLVDARGARRASAGRASDVAPSAGGDVRLCAARGPHHSQGPRRNPAGNHPHCDCRLPGRYGLSAPSLGQHAAQSQRRSCGNSISAERSPGVPFPVVLTIFIMAFVDTMGTLIGLSARAGFLDENGQLPQIERPMLVDAITTCLAPALGTTTAGAFVESATGIEAGGRTGFTVLVTGTCFLLTLFFAPFVAAIPAQAYGPALIIVGLFMLSPITRIDFADYSESIPAFAVVVLMAFTFNIAIGISAGFVLYPICKAGGGQGCSQLKPGLWVLTALSLLFFVFYPR